MSIPTSIFRPVHLACLLSLIACAASCASNDALSEASCGEPCVAKEYQDPSGDISLPEPAEEHSAAHPYDCVDHMVNADPTGLAPLPDPTAAISAPTDADYLALTAGATSVDGGTGTVSPLVLYGANAFPVLIDEGNRVLGAASRSGLGKVLVYGHEYYLTTTIKTGDATKILFNAIAWMSNKAAPVIGVHSSLTTLFNTLKTAGYNAQYTTPAQLASVNVYIGTAYTAYTEAEYQSFRTFISNGGGLIIGGQGWSFGGDVLDFPGNKILSGSGILITKAYDTTGGLDTISATPPSPLLGASFALARVTDIATGVSNLSAADQSLAAATVERAASILPISVKEFYDQSATLLTSQNPTINAATPLSPANNIPGRVATRIRHRFTQELPPNEITADPNAADFPGAIPQGTPRENLTVQIDANYAGRDARYASSGPANPVWRSTGAYAGPGELVSVTVPASLVNSGVAVQIGAHTDLLWNKTSWVRFPAIVRSYPIKSTQFDVASAFGGPIYITVPGGKALGQVSVTLNNVVRAPLYVHNQTTPAEWLTIRDYPAPWADVGSDKMIVTVPSSHVRTLNDPVQLMNRWDTIMDAVADLAAIPYTRVRPERYLADRDISAGYMHSGYPIMGPLGEAANLVGYAALATNWGFWHEVGHNHQWHPWVMQGTVESSVNWWSTYVSETVFNLPRAKGHTALLPENRLLRVQGYVAGGKKYATWGSDAWLPLEMYLQLQEWFGWQPFKDVNTEYLAIPAASSPSNDQAKVDQWVLRFSQKVGKNLGPFFTQGWGLPVSQTILDQLALLAPWPAGGTVPGIEAEPNDACAQALPIRAPFLTGTSTLPNKLDVDWFVLPVSANDVGKSVRAATSAGSSNTDTVVEVFEGSCGSLNSLGGPSSNTTVHENWLSTPITQAGSAFVKVSYSQAAVYAGDKYRLTVTFE